MGLLKNENTKTEIDQQNFKLKHTQNLWMYSLYFNQFVFENLENLRLGNKFIILLLIVKRTNNDHRTPRWLKKFQVSNKAVDH